MTIKEIENLINRSLFATLGYENENGQIEQRRVFCTWHKGISRHLISTNTSSNHVKNLLKNNNASLYFSDDVIFEGVSLSGYIIIHFEEYYKRLLWHDRDIIYYPKGVTDEDYCVLEFVVESLRFYRFDGKGNLTKEEINKLDYDKVFENKYELYNK